MAFAEGWRFGGVTCGEVVVFRCGDVVVFREAGRQVHERARQQESDPFFGCRCGRHSAQFFICQELHTILDLKKAWGLFSHDGKIKSKTLNMQRRCVVGCDCGVWSPLMVLASCEMSNHVARQQHG